MNISLSQLQAVAIELSETLELATVQEIRQPSSTAIAIRFYGSRKMTPGVLYLLLETSPRWARCHLISHRTTTLAQPSPFLGKLRKELENSRLVDVEMPWLDRVLVLRFKKGASNLALVAELTGHHPNIFITDENLQIILPMQPSSSHKRDLAVGARYQPPPPPEHQTTAQEGQESLTADSPSAALESHYDTLIARHSFLQTKTRIIAFLRKGADKTARRREAIAQDLQKAADAELYRNYGDLLKVNLAQARRGLTSISLVDPMQPDGPPVVIPLKAELTPKENLDWLFSRYKKGVRSKAPIQARLDAVGQSLELLESLKIQAHKLETAEELQQFVLSNRATLKGLPTLFPSVQAAKGGSDRAVPARHTPFRSFVSVSGRTILVGKGGKDNHALTFQVASPHDVWMHVAGFPGPHVVIPLARNQDPDPQTLLDAAHLAVHFGKGVKTGFCEVMWTRRKHVRAIKRGKPGQVLVAQEKRLAFDFDSERMNRLREESYSW